MAFLSSSLSSSSQSTPTSPLCHQHVFPLFLSTNTTYLLYAAVIDTPHLLLSLEQDPLYQEDTITHELIRLFHGLTQIQRLLATKTPISPLRFTLDSLPNRVFSILHTHGFATFIKNLPPTIIYPTFCHLYLSLPQDQCDSYVEQLKQFLLHHPLTHSPIPVPPPLSSCLSSPPPAETPTAVKSDPESDKEDHIQTIPIPVNHPQIFTIEGRNFLSSPSHVLPCPDCLCIPLASSDTICFHCHRNGHYCEDCPDYTCPHCHMSATGHPTRLCLTVRCDFCRNWGHTDILCPHHNCGVCGNPGHIVDNCPFERFSPSQATAMYGRPSPTAS